MGGALQCKAVETDALRQLLIVIRERLMTQRMTKIALLFSLILLGAGSLYAQSVPTVDRKSDSERTIINYMGCTYEFYVGKSDDMKPFWETLGLRVWVNKTKMFEGDPFSKEANSWVILDSKQQELFDWRGNDSLSLKIRGRNADPAPIVLNFSVTNLLVIPSDPSGSERDIVLHEPEVP
jgi:hypothetical protein